MRCVDWTAEYLDGQILVTLLRAEGLDAHLFDQETVRQDWFQILAYGGFRIMVPASQFDAARALTAARREGALALADEPDQHPICPRCDDAHGETDPRPRRWAFAAYLIWPNVSFAFAVIDFVAPAAIAAAFLPWLFLPASRHTSVGRYRCPACAHAWRAPAEPFARLRAAAETAGA